jgi:ribosome-binding protein aMBF1 (putative translation factor)
MPFERVSVGQIIDETLDADPVLKQMWDDSRTEYFVLGELVKLRKAKGLSQVELAEKSGNRQQVISRIENMENSPTLKTLCGLLDVLGYDIRFVPREQTQGIK